MQNRQNSEIVTLALIGIGAYFFIVKPLLDKTAQALNLMDTPEEKGEKKIIDKYENSGNASNPFSPVFWRQGGQGTVLLRVADAEQMAAIIYKAFGNFTDDEEAVFGVFRRLSTQSQVSWLADIFQKKYKMDLLNYIRQGYGIFPNAGLNNTELSQLLNIIDKLPKFKR